MSFIVRAARPQDLDALYRMAKSTGGGFTNLPPDRKTLRAKLERAAAAFARETDLPGDDLFVFILEDTDTGKARGTCQVFARVGGTWPFYSYRLSTLTQYSRELDRTFRAEMLTLSTDLEGASEVGGLWLDATERAAGVGGLLARSRYLFIRAHRPRFAERTLAELRGAHDESGGSPFWDGVAGRFFGMNFREADDFNAVHGNQFIADLMPKHPIYTALLPETAVAAIGVPHQSGRPAMRMLEREGFAFGNYIDIFDGGPTMIAETDRIATIREAVEAPVLAVATPDDAAIPALLSRGRLADFRACCGLVSTGGDGGVAIDPESASLLGVGPGDTVTWVAR